MCGGEALIHKLDGWSESAGTLGMSPDVHPSSTGSGTTRWVCCARATPSRRTTRPAPTGHPARTAGRAASPAARLLGEFLDVDNGPAIPLPGTAAPITGCLVHRSGKDFTDGRLRLAEHVQPLLAAVDQQRQLLEHWHGLPPTEDLQERAAHCALTSRETSVLLLLTDALTAAAIARRLGISARTAHKHVENICRKLGIRDRISTVLRTQRLGLLPQPRPAPPGRHRHRPQCARNSSSPVSSRSTSSALL